MSWFRIGGHMCRSRETAAAGRAGSRQAQEEGASIAPVTIEGRKIAKSFWGKSWCTNLERYSDYANRLPRGRSYVRNGLVVDLQIAKGEVAAMVSGSELYDVKITIAPVAATRWKAICRDCAGTINSLVELLQGRLAKGRDGSGLPGRRRPVSGAERNQALVQLSGLGRHVQARRGGALRRRRPARRTAAVAVRAARRRRKRVARRRRAGLSAVSKSAPAAAKVLDDGDVAALFGLEMAESAVSRRLGARGGKTVSTVKSDQGICAGADNGGRATQPIAPDAHKTDPNTVTLVGGRKKRAQRRPRIPSSSGRVDQAAASER